MAYLGCTCDIQPHGNNVPTRSLDSGVDAAESRLNLETLAERKNTYLGHCTTCNVIRWTYIAENPIPRLIGMNVPALLNRV